MELGHILNFFISLLVICNPMACLPALLTLSHGSTIEEKRRIGIVTAFAVVVIFLVVIWVGEPLLDFLSIRVPSFQVAGGMILFLLALSMLNAKPIRMHGGGGGGSMDGVSSAALYKESIAIVPLAMPLIAGPGAISLVLVNVGTFPSFTDHFFMSIAAFFVATTLGTILYFAPNLERILGANGINVINRLAGLIIAAMSVETFAKGALALFPGLGQ